MAITTKTSVNRRGAPLVESAVDRCTATLQTHFLDAKQGSVNADIVTGCQAGATLTGPARIPTGGGRDVVIEATASAPGVVTVEDCPDGTAWTPQATFSLRAHEPMGYRFTALAAQYRVKFACGTIGGASRVGIYSQSRF